MKDARRRPSRRCGIIGDHGCTHGGGHLLPLSVSSSTPRPPPSLSLSLSLVSKSESDARFFENQASAESALQGLSAGTTVLIGTPGKAPTVLIVMEDSVLLKKFLVPK